MDNSDNGPYQVGSKLFLTRNRQGSHNNVRYTTQVESSSSATPFGYEPGLSGLAVPGPVHAFASTGNQISLPDTQQEPTSPSSGYFTALTPSESLSTGLSDCHVTRVGRGVEDSSFNRSGGFSDLAQWRGVSADILTPSASLASDDAGSSSCSIHNDSASQVGSKERFPMLQEFNDHNQLDIDNANLQYAEEIDGYNSAYLGRESSQIQTPSMYTSNQSQKEAAPWNGLALQHDERHVLPVNINDNYLSFNFEMWIAHMSRLSPNEGLGGSDVEPVPRSPAERNHRSRKKPQNCNRGQNARHAARNNLRKHRRLLSAARHPALGPATSTASMNSAATKGRRPAGSHLPEEDRKSAKQVRRRGACFRCRSMKEKCTPGELPCATCRRLAEENKFRIWQTPCSDKRLDERCEYLLPAPLVSQISVSEMRALLDQYRGACHQVFLLSLSIGFGEPWILKAVELLPGSHITHDMFGFHGQSGKPFELTNPPIVPLWIEPPLMQSSIDGWLDKMISNPQAGWQRHWFPARTQIWHLRILEGICNQYHHFDAPYNQFGRLAHQTLRGALKLSVLSYVMSHAFLVPGDQVDILFRHIEHPVFGGQAGHGKVCPRPANKFVKMMALPVMHLVTKMTLSGLHELLRATVPDAILWDKAFAVTFLCLMAIGSAQRSLFQRASVCAAKGDANFGRQYAFSYAQSMDLELVVHVIGMFNDRFHMGSKIKAFNPFSENCMDRNPPLSFFATHVREVTNAHYRPLAPCDDFGDVGAERLLARFMEPFFLKL